MRWLTILLLGGCDLVFPLADPPSRPPGCSPASMLVDGFDGTGPVSKPWIVAADLANVITETGKLDVNAENIGLYVVETGPFFEMREQRFSVYVHHAGSLNSGDAIAFELLTQEATANRLVMRLEAEEGTTKLVAGHIDLVNGIPLPPATVARLDYVESIHQYWGMEQKGDKTRWLVSADGVEFETLVEKTGLDWVTYMQPRLVVDVANPPLRVEFDDVNGRDGPSGKACPAATLFEDFVAEQSVDWRRFEQACTMTFVDGALRAAIDDLDDRHFCAIQTATIYDLKDSPVTLDVLEIVGAGDIAAVFEVETLSGATGTFLSDGTVLFAVANGNTTPGVGTFDPATRYWRLRATADDDLLWETSADGRLFEPFANSGAGALGALDAVQVVVAFGGDGVVTGGIARFGGINTR